MKKIFGMLVASALILAVFAAVRAQDGPAPGVFDSYVLSLSWQPAFCRLNPDRKECLTQTPERYDARNFVLHGLWPSKKDDSRHSYGFCGVSASVRKLDKASAWCRMPEPAIKEETKKDLAVYMPGYASCLERHEWYKHGICSGMEAQRYFSTSVELVKKFSATRFGRYVASHVGETIGSDTLLREFEKDFGPGSRRLVSLYCRNIGGSASLVEVRTSLANPLPQGDLRDMFGSPDDPVPGHGDCPGSFLVPGVRPSGAENEARPLSPAPLLSKGGRPVDWWFVFKFNAATFPACGSAQRSCPFGGAAQSYRDGFGQQFVYASSADPILRKGSGCVGDTLADPVGATFDQVYNGAYHYVIWNDRFHGNPMRNTGPPWGYSKGMVAWDEKGEGFVMQVSTPSWPGSGSKSFPRTEGNSLGCMAENNVRASEHFFALRLTGDDLVKVLQALRNADVVTDPDIRQIVNNGGPPEIQALVDGLGKRSAGWDRTRTFLSSGVQLISKPARLAVPPWQMVSAALAGTPLRVATWWGEPMIGTTVPSTTVGCWYGRLGGSGRVEVATTGQWDGSVIGLKGGLHADANNAKIGVSTDPTRSYVIFGDLDQQGALSGNCTRGQNGRGGIFFVLANKALFKSVTGLLKGQTAPLVMR